MKKHYYDSLSDFYDDIKNLVSSPRYNWRKDYDRPHFTGLSRSEILKSQYSYPFGVEKLRNLANFEIQKDIKIRYWDQFDGFDIDIDRMYSDLDFLRNERKQRKLPKTMDIFINISENCDITYSAMLNKTYAALKIIDHLETLGVRTALYACISCLPKVNGRYIEPLYIEICIKRHADDVNLGALCTAISPWFFRHWFFLWIEGRYKNLDVVIGQATTIPESEAQKGITIDNGQCLNLYMANTFISSLKIA
jgi:hypothetical protein